MVLLMSLKSLLLLLLLLLELVLSVRKRQLLVREPLLL